MWKNRVETDRQTDRPLMTTYTAHALCLLDNYGYTHPLIICSFYCFSTAKLISTPRPDVTFYVHCLSFLCLLLWLFHKFRLRSYPTEFDGIWYWISKILSVDFKVDTLCAIKTHFGKYCNVRVLWRWILKYILMVRDNAQLNRWILINALHGSRRSLLTGFRDD
jgi:hypothetical protein